MTQHSTKSYDYIFLGTGCASLSILMRMIGSGKFLNKKFLLIDKELKNKNDRTWCFWEKDKGYFEALVYRKWDNLLFKSTELSLELSIAPYQYKMIRGIDFYEHCFNRIHDNLNIDILTGEIDFDHNNALKIDGKNLAVKNALVFNSIYRPKTKDQHNFYLLQHFKGWLIETETDQFHRNQGTLMDFTVQQNFGSAFVYVLPISPNKALIEYTLFTKDLLQQEAYISELNQYLKHLGINKFTIIEEEFGIIPMTNSKLSLYENGMYNIGTAGGQTKASSGYTFQFIQKHADLIVADLILQKHPSKKPGNSKRFHFYDSTLLHILSKNRLPGKEIFTCLFKKNKASQVFKFLDNETTLIEELKIINTLPKKEFLIAGIKEFVKMF